MAYSQIILEFTGVPNVGEYLNIRENTLGLNLNEIFVETRASAGQTTLPIFEPDDGSHPDRYMGFVSGYYKSAFNADYNGTFNFTVSDTNGPINTGTGTVIITANYANADFELLFNNAPVTVTITNYVEEVNSVTPLALNFNVVSTSETTIPQNLIINALAPWTIESPLPDWISFSATSGVSDATITVTPINFSGLATGVYSEEVSIVIGVDSFVITLTLTVFSFLANPFAPGKLYFTKELDYLRFTSETPGTYVAISIEITVFKINTYTPIIYTRVYNFPLFQGAGSFHVGDIVHDLFEEIEELSDFVPDLKSNYYRTQYRPAEISILFEEKTFGATVPGLISGSIDMFKMAKGHKPFMTENQLALLTVSQQEITRITPNSFIGTSFVYFGTPRIVVKKNNVIIEDFEIAPDANKEIYSYFRFINNLKPGDSIDLIIINGLETRSQRFVVFKNGLESTYFFFENDNSVLEPFEFSGRRRIQSPMKHITTTKLKNRHSYVSKVKSIVDQTMIVNTGDLGKSDHRIITALVASTKVWCSLDNPDGPYFRVNATTTKVDNQDTSTNEENMNIEFNILEDADVSIYPR